MMQNAVEGEHDEKFQIGGISKEQKPICNSSRDTASEGIY